MHEYDDHDVDPPNSPRRICRNVPELMEVLSAEVRFEFLRSLARRPMTVSELARELALKQPCASQHLGHLRKATLVVYEQVKKGRVYRLSDQVEAVIEGGVVYLKLTAADGDSILVRTQIAWRMQALAEGDLSERARKRAAELADDAEVRVMAPKTMICPPQGPGTETTITRPLPNGEHNDRRLPPPGSAIVREYKRRTIRVVVLSDGHRRCRRSMAGDAIEHATAALLEELVSFCPSPRDRKNLGRVLDATKKVMDKARDVIEAKLESGELEKAAEQALAQLDETQNDSSGNAPASSGSIHPP